MVPLPLFKLAALFMRHVSKYGANRIKAQAHTHPRFRSFAARYGQSIHQLNMRLSVLVLRNAEAEARAREKAEAPTVKTREQVEKETTELLARQGQKSAKDPASSGSGSGSGSSGSGSSRERESKSAPKSVWKRKFRPLPDAKAVELFADVIGDAFILSVGAALVTYEYWRSSSKPDPNLDRIDSLNRQVDEMASRAAELEEAETRQRQRLESLEAALRDLKDPKTSRPLLPTLQPAASHAESLGRAGSGRSIVDST